MRIARIDATPHERLERAALVVHDHAVDVGERGGQRGPDVAVGLVPEAVGQRRRQAPPYSLVQLEGAPINFVFGFRRSVFQFAKKVRQFLLPAKLPNVLPVRLDFFRKPNCALSQRS